MQRYDIIRATARLQEHDVKVSLPATCLCVEMALVAMFHVYAYPLGPYKVWRRPRACDNYVVGNMRTYTGLGLAVVALIEMVNAKDLVVGIGRAFKYLLFDIRHRHHEIGYANNHVGQPLSHRTTLSSNSSRGPSRDKQQSIKPKVEVMEVQTHIKRPQAVILKH